MAASTLSPRRTSAKREQVCRSLPTWRLGEGSGPGSWGGETEAGFICPINYSSRGVVLGGPGSGEIKSLLVGLSLHFLCSVRRFKD